MKNFRLSHLALAIVPLSLISSLANADCNTAAPTVNIIPGIVQSIEPSAGFTTNYYWYAVSVTNNNSASCGPTTFNVQTNSGNAGSFLIPTISSTVTLNPGQTTRVKLNIRASTSGGTIGATYIVPVYVSSASSPNLIGASAAFLKVVNDCASNVPYMEITPASQTGVAGTTYTNYSSTIRNNDPAKNQAGAWCPSSFYNFVRTDSFGGGLQTIGEQVSPQVSGGDPFKVVVPAGTASGSYPVSIKGTDSTNPARIGQSLAELIIQ